MNPIVRNILAVLAGLVVGSAVNMGLIMAGGAVLPPPAGADVGSMESLAATMHLFGPQHFIFPYLAHALGTLVGAVVAALLAASHRDRMAMVIGAFFLLGGIVSSVQLPAPLWFKALDVITAYLPMGYLGGRIAAVIRPVHR
jgi:hypothetical protein